MERINADANEMPKCESVVRGCLSKKCLCSNWDSEDATGKMKQEDKKAGGGERRG